MKEVEQVSTTWDEGRYFDRWMLVHFLGGLTGGLSNILFGLSTLGVYSLGTVLMIGWELVEFALGIGESNANRVIDVVFGLAGVAVALWLASGLGERAESVAFVGSGLAFGVGGLFGWMAYRRRIRG